MTTKEELMSYAERITMENELLDYISHLADDFDQSEEAVLEYLQHLNGLEQSPDEVLDYLEHFGVKGQKWGVRKARGDRGGFIARANSKKKPPGPDVKKLSNEELKSMVARMQLEKQFNELSKQTNRTYSGAGAKFAGDILKDVGKQHARKLIVEGLGAAGTIATAVMIGNRMSG